MVQVKGDRHLGLARQTAHEPRKQRGRGIPQRTGCGLQKNRRTQRVGSLHDGLRHFQVFGIEGTHGIMTLLRGQQQLTGRDKWHGISS